MLKRQLARANEENTNLKAEMLKIENRKDNAYKDLNEVMGVISKIN